MEHEKANTNRNLNLNSNSELILERLKFYADTPVKSNKYFCWKLSSILTLKDALWRFFGKGWNIRAAWYEKINLSTGEVIENIKLKIRELEEEYLDEKLHTKK
jgi:hypothetical protein